MPVDQQGEPVWYGDWLAEITPWKWQIAVDAHRRTIDLAAELGARAVVVHLGNSGARRVQPEIFEAIREHGVGGHEHLSLVEEARAARRAADGNGALEAAIRSARQLGEHARGTGVKLGLEIRDGYTEIPSLEEFPLVFEACVGLPVFYWHDMGHGSKLENAGLVRARDYLERFGDRLIGVHLHDTTLDRDHQAPGDGETDFSMILPHLTPATIRTLELAPRVTADRIGPGVQALRRAGLT
jgi:sugar phosphate isomerase/epimerase